MAIYAIGDIHGDIASLSEALTELRKRLRGKDRVVFLGDYIDRGSDSKGCIDLLIAFRQEYPKTIFLRGNHDQFLLTCFDHSIKQSEGAYCEISDETEIWLQNGGDTTLRSYGVADLVDWQSSISRSHLDFLSETRMEWKSKHFHFVHAGILPKGAKWPDPDRDPKLWIRTSFMNCTDDFGRIVVFGHTVQKRHKPLVMANKIGIDTGAVFGGALSVAKFDGLRRTEDGLPAFSVLQFYRKANKIAQREWAN